MPELWRKFFETKDEVAPPCSFRAFRMSGRESALFTPACAGCLLAAPFPHEKLRSPSPSCHGALTRKNLEPLETPVLRDW